MAQLSPILSPSHFLSDFLIFCHYFLSFFLHSHCFGLVMPGRCGRRRTPYQCPAYPTGAAASLAVVSAAVSKSGAGTGSMDIQSTAAYHLLSWSLCLQQLWPLAPLFHWRSCATSWSLFLDNSVLIWARIPLQLLRLGLLSGSSVSLSFVGWSAVSHASNRGPAFSDHRLQIALYPYDGGKKQNFSV